MKGTDRTATLIADPGTEKERTYTKSCRADGVFVMYLYGDYENFYLDESCIQDRSTAATYWFMQPKESDCAAGHKPHVQEFAAKNERAA